MYAKLMNENVRIRAENVMLRKVVFALIAQADKDPFMSIGHFAEHGPASAALAEIRKLNDERERHMAQQIAALEAVPGEVEYEYEVWQGDAWQAGGRETDYASAQSEADHYAMMYAPDGPVEVRIYEKRLLSAHQQPNRRPYNASGSLSEYGVFPECDAQQPAAGDDVVVERIAALLYEEATDEPWTVAGVEHPGPDRDYYRGLASKIVALAAAMEGEK